MNNEFSKSLGVVAIEPKGEYNSEIYYEKLNLVSYNNSAYIATQPSQGILPTNTNYWQFIGAGTPENLVDSKILANIIDNLESNDENKSLSAKQGKVLKEKIEEINKTIKFHTVHNSSATYIVEFANGKKLIVDTGLANQWTYVKEAIDNLGITKFDYVVITHFHPDHGGNIENLINNYDVSDAQWFIQMKPDFENHAEDIAESESDYNSYLSKITNNGIIPIVPDNDSYLNIDENTKLHFLNTDKQAAESYYNTNVEWYDVGKPNFNVFSLVVEIIYKKIHILCTGDIERPAEEKITKYLGKQNIMTMPHHGVNRDAYIPFYQATMPDYSIAQYIRPTVDETSENWVKNEFKSFVTLKNQNSKIITAKWSKSINGLFTFISNGNTVSSNVKDSGIGYRVCEGHHLYSRLDELVNYSTQLPSNITLEQLINNMPLGSIYHGLIGSAMEERYPVAYNDLKTIFGDFLATYSNLDIYTDYSVYSSLVIKLYNSNNEFIATKISSGDWIVRGSGHLGNVSGIDNLLDLIESLPPGFYDVPYYLDNDENSPLVKNGGYQLNITLISNEPGDVRASILATLRYVGEGAACYTANGFVNTSVQGKKYVWNKLA